MNKHAVSILRHRQAAAFTVIELLMVIAVLSLLLAILIPALSGSKNSARMVTCQSHLRQLALADMSYANDYHGYSVPGALNIDSSNLQRWYGQRQSRHEPFDPDKGPLAPYLGQTHLECPQTVRYEPLEPNDEVYEYGNGGYGYNLVYIGSNIWHSGYGQPDTSSSTKLSKIHQPQATILFADTAMSHWVDSQQVLIRYSFIEPRYFIIDKEPSPVWLVPPSMHFRHRKRACLVWVDGHVGDRKMTPCNETLDDGTTPVLFDISWLEPWDNSLFDLK